MGTEERVDEGLGKRWRGLDRFRGKVKMDIEISGKGEVERLEVSLIKSNLKQFINSIIHPNCPKNLCKKSIFVNKCY